ncbi:hypothetical protein [Pseudomonas sp. LF19]|uniref:hypothetical protein n=1 Tax=Pseudomonas sp. LF19 TaxID=2899115 RepID=UPI001F30429E|nr:hypothetical protein [Pseudomonas sp. LF19]MCE5981978.1 hypothetical protein [Pseudomonas sp. LF19]
MKVDDAVETITRFFNDLIGAWVPGSVLAMGLVVMHLGPKSFQSIAKLGEGAGVALTMAGLLFALGHVLLAINEHAINPLLKHTRFLTTFDEATAKSRQSYKWFSELVGEAQNGAGLTSWGFHDLRSVALSVSTEAATLGRRFMFISMLCKGVGTALMIIGLDYLICSFLAPKLMYTYEQSAPWYVQGILLFGTAILLFKQGESFYARAMTTPFSVAVAELKFKKEANAVTP